MTYKRFCVFCGAPPERKNKEHVLPRWLISLTGDPNRVVNFGVDYQSGKLLRFAWSSFVAPSCEDCNGKFATLEAAAKPLIQRLLERDALDSEEYLIVFDWLDKVRIG